MGLQHKTVEQLEGELELPAAQLLGLFNKVVRKLAAALTAVLEREVEQDMVARREVDLTPATQSVDQDLVGANLLPQLLVLWSLLHIPVHKRSLKPQCCCWC